MLMKLQIGKICRGTGIAYIECRVLNVAKGNIIRFSAKSEAAVELPVAVYKLNKDVSTYVLATPLLETRRVDVNVEEIDKARRVVSSAERRFSRFFIKWASRFNYRFFRVDSLSMRDIEKSVYSNQIHINLLVCHWPDHGNEIIVKGVVCTPIADRNVDLRVLNARGTEVKDIKLYRGSTVMTNSDGVVRKEVSFTARIPRDETVCLVARGEEGTRTAFTCFDEPSRNYYRSTLEPRYYPLADPNGWDAVFRNKMQKFEHESPDDYKVEGGPLFSIVVPLYHTPVNLFNEMVDSVLSQLYQNWELILVNSTPGDAELAAAIARLDDNRIRVIKLETNGGISFNTNKGTEAAQGDYVVFFDHDDLLSPIALFRYAKEITANPEIDALYCDEDNLSEDGAFCNPHFKSVFNIDLLRCHNFITHLVAVRSSLVRQLPLRSEYDGAQDYDFLLRLSELTDKIVHVPEVLYHWRMSDRSTAKNAGNKSYAQDAGIAALRAHLERCGLSAVVEETVTPFIYRTRYEVVDSPLVSVIIPNKDNAAVLARCLSSLTRITDYHNFEVIVVENNSTEAETFAFYREAEKRYPFVRVLTWEGPFNYSAINNFGSQYASGDFFLLLNNDIEIQSPTWLQSMLGICQRKDVGVVGAKLLYPDNTIQHAGVTMVHCPHLVEMGGPVHIFNHFDKDDQGYMWRAQLTQDVSAVTGACLLTKASVFRQVGGLTEDFAVAYNDIDYCLKVAENGFRVVYDAEAVLYHYESLSRGSDFAPDKVNRFVSEQGKLRAKWPRYYSEGDPFYSKYAL